MVLTIAHLDRTRYAPYAVFLNEGRHAQQLREMGVPVFVLSHTLYAPAASVRKRIYIKLFQLIGAYLPGTYLLVYRFLHRTLIRDLKEVITTYHIALVHLNVCTARDLFGVFAAKETQVPCVSHLRSIKVISFPRPAQIFANKYVCRYIAISNFVTDIWRVMGIDTSRCATVLNGIVPLAPTVRDYTTIAQRESVTFSTVGRLIGWKNHAWLLESFARYLSCHSNAHLYIIGDGPEKNALVKQAQQYGISAHVTFAGDVTDPYALLRESDIFIFPSRKEPFGRAVLEAMSLGMPIIAADSGGVPEFLEHHVTGLLVPLNDVQALTAAMRELASNGALCEQLAQAAREHATHELNIKRTVEQVERVYRTCLQR